MSEKYMGLHMCGLDHLSAHVIEIWIPSWMQALSTPMFESPPQAPKNHHVPKGSLSSTRLERKLRNLTPQCKVGERHNGVTETRTVYPVKRGWHFIFPPSASASIPRLWYDIRSLFITTQPPGRPLYMIAWLWELLKEWKFPPQERRRRRKKVGGGYLFCRVTSKRALARIWR